MALRLTEDYFEDGIGRFRCVIVAGDDDSPEYVLMRLLEISVHWSSNLGVWRWVGGHWKILQHEIAQHEHQILRPRLGLQDSRSDRRRL